MNFRAGHSRNEGRSKNLVGEQIAGNGRSLKNEDLASIRVKKGGSKNPPDTRGSMIPALKVETELEHSATQEPFPNFQELGRFTI